MALTDTIALTKVATVEGDLSLTGGAQDALLERYILAVSQTIESYCNRKFRKETVVETIRGSSTLRLVLARPPLVSITSITNDGATVDSSTYRIENADAGIVEADNVWVRPGLELGAAAEIIPATGKRNLVVTYVGGWVLPNDATGTRNLPYDIEEACLLTVTSLYRRRGQDRQASSLGLGDYSVGYGGLNTAIGRGEGGIIPDEAISILKLYRRPL